MCPKTALAVLATCLVMGCGQLAQANDFTDRLKATQDTSVNFDSNTGADFEAWADENQIQTPAAAWAKLQRADWMFWLVKQRSLNAKLNDAKMRLFVSDCAEQVLPLFEHLYPNDRRPRSAVEEARRFSRGEATKEELAAADRRAGAVAEAAKKTESEGIPDDVQANSSDIEGASYAASVAAACAKPAWYTDDDVKFDQKMADDAVKDAVTALAGVVSNAGVAEAHAKAVAIEAGSATAVDAQEASEEAAEAEGAVDTAKAEVQDARENAAGETFWYINQQIAWYAQCTAKDAAAAE